VKLTRGPARSSDGIECHKWAPWASLSHAVLAFLLSALGACGGGGGSGGGTGSSYTIGGDLTGLASGQQITLHNGVEALALTTNGVFTFAAKVVNGGNYNVTVAAQPVGQTCVISNATGTGVNANVSNVSVACTYQTFTLGGNLTGLPSGQQVTLQNNGADPVTLAANEAFTFPSTSHYFDTYSVTVSAQPGPSNEFCSVSNGSGTISGTVTNIQITCATELVLYNFTSANSANGANPGGRLLIDGAGNIYGTAAGAVFKLAPAAGGGYSESVLLPADPTGGVIMDSTGNLYGTTMFGGGTFGSAFELSPTLAGGYTESNLHDFSGTTADGGEPTGDLLVDSAGNLFGTTSIGGSYQAGTVFKLSPAPGGGYSYSILYSFTGTTVDGGQPNGGLVMDSAGNLYGTTMTAAIPPGGSINDQGFGTVFKLAPTAGGSYTETTLYVFKGFGGSTPRAGLIMDSAGNLYGTTKLGSGNFGSGYGTVFKLTPDMNGVYTESSLYNFTGGGDGGGPLGALVMDGAGNLYGTASYGGGGTANCTNGCGTIFKLTPATNGNYTETTLYSFAGGSSGGGPAATLIMDAAGNLYGTTFSGNGINVTGGADAGNVFEILLH
jgi:uncharacterized repeat protein (TIGR03803 family)